MSISRRSRLSRILFGAAAAAVAGSTLAGCSFISDDDGPSLLETSKREM